MLTVTADSVLEATLKRLTSASELRDSGGHVLGYYVPASRPDSEAYAKAAATFDVVEMKRRKASGEKGLTTSEVLRHVQSQETP